MNSSRKKRLSSLEIQKELMTLAEHFLRDLKTGECKPGSLLPSLHQLEELYGVSYHLARQFYSRLEERGILLSVKGKGFFLAKMPDGETILPNMLLYRRGILAVGKIDMTLFASALNASFCWLSELEKAYTASFCKSVWTGGFRRIEVSRSAGPDSSCRSHLSESSQSSSEQRGTETLPGSLDLP